MNVWRLLIIPINTETGRRAGRTAASAQPEVPHVVDGTVDHLVPFSTHMLREYGYVSARRPAVEPTAIYVHQWRRYSALHRRESIFVVCGDWYVRRAVPPSNHLEATIEQRRHAHQGGTGRAYETTQCLTGFCHGDPQLDIRGTSRAVQSVALVLLSS